MKVFGCHVAVLIIGIAITPCMQAQDLLPATVRVTVTPAATVSLNHQEGKKGDVFTFTLQPNKSALLKVSEPGYTTQYRTITLDAGERAYEEFNLVREPIPVLFRANVPATIRCEGATLGTTPYHHFFPAPKSYRIVVQAQGYQEQIHTINLTNGRPQVKHFELLSNSGAIQITSDPAGANVLLDGIQHPPTPCTIKKLRERDYTLTLRKEGYKPVTHSLKVSAGETAPINITLERLPAGLNIFTIPEGARVYIDQVFRGNSDLSVGEIADGKHTVRVEKPGYAECIREITLQAGNTHVEEFRLEIIRGTLMIRTEPAIVAVYSDNKKLFETAPKNPNDVRSDITSFLLPPGKHLLTFKAEGYADKTSEVTIHANQTTKLGIRLEFKPNFKVRTMRGTYTGVLIQQMSDGSIKLETQPGLQQTFMAEEITGWELLQDNE